MTRTSIQDATSAKTIGRVKDLSPSAIKRLLGPNGHDRGVPTIKPVHMDAEPAIWDTWRRLEYPHNDNIKEATYQEAYEVQRNRPWPLPQESFVRYKKRQFRNRGRPYNQKETELVHEEWIGWRLEIGALAPTDDSRGAEFAKPLMLNQAVRTVP